MKKLSEIINIYEACAAISNVSTIVSKPFLGKLYGNDNIPNKVSFNRVGHLFWLQGTFCWEDIFCSFAITSNPFLTLILGNRTQLQVSSLEMFGEVYRSKGMYWHFQSMFMSKTCRPLPRDNGVQEKAYELRWIPFRMKWID